MKAESTLTNMQVVIIPPRKPKQYEPLTVGRELGDCLVANIPLYTLIATELTRAGFEIIPEGKEGERTVRLPLDHWIEVGALCMLARGDTATQLVDSAGDIVAWKGTSTPEDCHAKMVTEAVCFKIEYSWDLLKLNEDVLDALPEPEILGTVHPLAEIDGNLQLGEGSRVLPGVVIEGNVVIGRNCKIGPNAYIRGNTTIGDNCVIGNAVEVKNSVIYPNTAISHLSYVGDSIIGCHVNIGAGTIISNHRHDTRKHRSLFQGQLIDTGRDKLGAIIGDGVRTGINTSIYPGRKIGKGRTTMPGQVVTTDLM